MRISDTALFARFSQSAGPHVSWRKPNRISEGVFFVLLVALFIISLLPFLLAPSIPLTLSLSLPPFFLIFVQAHFNRRKVVEVLRNEGTFLETFKTNSAQCWEELKLDPSKAITEAEIVGLVPEEIRRRSQFAKTLLEELASGKLYLLEAPRDSLIRPFRDDLEKKIDEIVYLASLSNRVGILGTFFGFIFALGTLSTFFASMGSLSADTNAGGLDTVSSGDLIQTTLQNLAYAFVKCVYGLALAILLTTQASHLRKILDHIYPLFNEALSYGLGFVNRMTLADPAIHSSLVEVRNALKNLNQRLFDHSGTVAEALREHGKLINEQTKLFSSAAHEITEVQRNWDGAFKKLNEAGQAFEERTAVGMERVERGFSATASIFEGAIKSLDVARSELTRENDSLLQTLKNSEDNSVKRFDAFLSHVAEQDKKFGQWAEIAKTAFQSLRQQSETIQDNLKISHTSSEAGVNANKDLVAANDRLERAIHTLGQSMNAIQHRSRIKMQLGWVFLAGCLILLIDLNVLDDPLKLKLLLNSVMSWPS